MFFAIVEKCQIVFRRIGDRTREAFALDTKALIFLEEEKYPLALQTIGQAIGMLEEGENKGYLVEALQTKIKVLLSFDDIFSATRVLIEAVEIARTSISEHAAEGVIREYEKAVRKNKTLRLTAVYEEKKSASAKNIEDLELILPASLSNYSDYQVVRINNTYLEKYGLTQGSLAVIAAGTEVGRGTLAAVLVIAENSVICGFYDTDFGIVSIGTPESEPQVFSDNEVRVLGAIIGVGLPNESSGDKIAVKEISTI